MFYLVLKFTFALIVILLMIYILAKLANKQKGTLGAGKQIKVLDRTQISKDSYIVIVKIRNKGYVISYAAGKSDIIDELSEDDICAIEQDVENTRQEMLNKYNDAADLIMKKLHLKK